MTDQTARPSEAQLTEWKARHIKRTAYAVVDGHDQEPPYEICAYCGFYWPCSVVLLLVELERVRGVVAAAESWTDCDQAKVGYVRAMKVESDLLSAVKQYRRGGSE